jgi:hypothetical protein
MDATMLYLDGNQLGVLDTPAFIGRKRVRTLFLNASSITQVLTYEAIFLLIFKYFIRHRFRFHSVGGCWDGTQECCDFGIGNHTL